MKTLFKILTILILVCLIQCQQPEPQSQDDCDDGTYFFLSTSNNFDNSCRECPTQCGNCEKTDLNNTGDQKGPIICTECSDSQRDINLDCKCKKGYYEINQQAQCGECDSSCASCQFNASFCTECASSDKILENGECKNKVDAESSDSEKEESSNLGLILGIVIAVVVVILAGVLGVFFYKKKQLEKNKKKPSEEEPKSQPQEIQKPDQKEDVENKYIVKDDEIQKKPTIDGQDQQPAQ